ncbi:MAG: phosphoglucosamine mutase, partial [Peptococcaceae bacterium]|nr:phosphoglucosamine mutase [Peptococcaceae bacterium]
DALPISRISGDMLEAALIAGICSAGIDVVIAGVVPTPAVACLIKELGAIGGVVISASHNPVEDNGIKFFGPEGFKLSDEIEEEIEKLTMDQSPIPLPVGEKVGRCHNLPDASERYEEFLLNAVNVDLSGIKIVLDCANGASYKVGPRVLEKMGAEVITIFNNPNGLNINKGCGSTHLTELKDAVKKHGADLGLANDGDADRVLAVDSHGRVVDGDQIMVICADYLKSKGQLANNAVVVTVMSNLGLHLALKEKGITVFETKVGDRYVVEECLKTGAVLGGEQSGHILFLKHTTTGDGLLTSLMLLAAIKEKAMSLSELASQMEVLPQILENIRVKDKNYIMEHSQLAEAVNNAEKVLSGQGRVLVRPSGTESLVRVMVEGRDIEVLKNLVDKIGAVIKTLD